MSQTEPSDRHYELFGRLLVQWRERQGVTQQAAARRVGAPSDTTLSAIESGTWRTRSNAGNVTLRKVDAAMGWPPGIAKTLLLDSKPDVLEDQDFIAAVFEELESAPTDYQVSTGGVPASVQPQLDLEQERARLIAAVSSALPTLRLGDLGAVALVVRSLLPSGAPEVAALNSSLQRVPLLSQYEPATQSVTIGPSSAALERRAAHRVADLIAAHDELHTIEDEQLGDENA